MENATVLWDETNTAHVAENGVTPEEFEEVLRDPRNPTAASDSTGRPVRFGWTSTGKHIMVVWEEVCDDPLIVYPVTAYEVPPRTKG
jgi:hypothetical protein